MNITEQLIHYEQGSLNNQQTIQLFQHLVNTGLAWQLQGTYGRTAAAMIDCGMISQASAKQL